MAHEAKIESEYKVLIKKAETEFDKSSYIKAKGFYLEAAHLKPAEEHPKERLLIIENILAKLASDLKAKNDSIALVKEINNKYQVALSNAKSSCLKGDFLISKTFYEEAAGLKPAEAEPKNQLEIVISKLAEIAKQKEIDSIYEAGIFLADSLVIAKAFESAISAYNEALRIKPAELYPKKQLKYIQSEIFDIERKKKAIRRQEAERKYADAISAANKAVTDKKYEEAQAAFQEARCQFIRKMKPQKRDLNLFHSR